MPQIYKIYINETALILSDELPSDIQDYQELNYKDFKFRKFYAAAASHNTPQTFVLISDKVKKLFKKIRKGLTLIKAAGGLVSNEEHKYLFIFRKAKWDLPKGKLDKGESSRKAAVREVEEECGIKVSELKKKICNTYHIYEMDGQTVLKKTAWYRMKAVDQPHLTPQLEEDITEARWIAPGDFMMVKENTYPLILDVIRVVEE